MKLLAAIVAFPDRVVVSDAATSEGDGSGRKLLFEPVIKSGHTIQNAGNFLVTAERASARFSREFNSFGRIHRNNPSLTRIPTSFSSAANAASALARNRFIASSTESVSCSVFGST